MICFLFICLWFSGGWTIENGWNGFLPLKSDRSAIETLLKKNTPDYSTDTVNKSQNEIEIKYQGKELLLFVTYSTSPCRLTNSNGDIRLLPIHTVLNYRVITKDLPISSIKFNKSEFERKEALHVAQFFNYLNSEKGISMGTNQIDDGEERIRIISYFFPSEMKDKVRCE